MSRFSSEFAAGGLPELDYEFGQSVRFTPDTGDADTLTARVKQIESRIEQNDRGREDRRAWLVLVPETDWDASDLPSPTRLMTATITEGDFRVSEPPTTHNGVIRLVIGARASIERSAPNYREARRFRPGRF